MANSGAEPSKQGLTRPDMNKYDVIKEGLAEILISKSAKGVQSIKEGENAPQSVFYNPIQQFNRDLSVIVIRVFGEGLMSTRKEKYEAKLRLIEKGGRGKKRKRGEESADLENLAGKKKAAGDGTGGLEKAIREDKQAQNGQDDVVVTPSVRANSIGEDVTDQKRATAMEENPSSANDEGQTLVPSDKPALRLCTEDELPKALDGEISTRTDNEVIEKTTNAGTASSNTENDKVPHANANPKPWRPSFRILDALSATGLRALRYAKEIPLATTITANDLSSAATASIRINVQHNDLTSKIHTITGNANKHMYDLATRINGALPGGESGRYDVVDLDPYGTATPFFDAAVQALADGGLLCVTCTDAGVFASSGYPEKTFSQYGGLPFKGPQSHEGGLRLIVNAIATSAARYGLAIEPLLSLSIDFYARVFVCLRRSPADVKFLAGRTMVVYNCDEGCGAWTTQLLAANKSKKDKKGGTFYKHNLAQAPSANEFCKHCGFKTHLAGPMWAGPLHNPYFIQRVLDLLPSLEKSTYVTLPRIEGMLSLALDESLSSNVPKAVDDPQAMKSTNSICTDHTTLDHHPFFIVPSALAKALHCSAPSFAQIRGALKHLGYRVGRSHTKPGSLRTDAPWDVIWEIMREWVRQMAPIKESALRKGMAGWVIMQKSRSNAHLHEEKASLLALLENAKTAEELKTELEAGLYRLGNKEARKTEEGRKAVPKQPPPEKTGTDEKSIQLHEINVVFDEKLGRAGEGKKVVRYPPNPRENWGPMNRAKGGD